MASGAAKKTVPDLRIVLLGTTGSGKSATGNTILGTEVFKVDCSLEPVTKESQRQEAEVNGKKISVIDTPENPFSEEKKYSPMSNPGPHVFLLVIRLGVRLGKEQERFVKQIEKHFGKDVIHYTIILFTFKDHMEDEKKNVEDFIRESEYLRFLVNRCGGRHHVFNNKNRVDRTQVSELLDKIEAMVKWNKGQRYKNQNKK